MMCAIPITLIEYGREAIIKADTQKEAIQKLRHYKWEYLSDTS